MTKYKRLPARDAVKAEKAAAKEAKRLAEVEVSMAKYDERGAWGPFVGALLFFALPAGAIMTAVTGMR